jgi:hypothetical protein
VIAGPPRKASASSSDSQWSTLSAQGEKLGFGGGGRAQRGLERHAPGRGPSGGQQRVHLGLTRAQRFLGAVDRPLPHARLGEQDLEEVLQLEQAEDEHGEGQHQSHRPREVSHAAARGTRP